MSDRHCFVCGATRDTRQIPIGQSTGKWRCVDSTACSNRVYDAMQRRRRNRTTEDKDFGPAPS